MQTRMETMPGLGDGAVRLFFCGDVMTGRGIDQILPHPGEPTLHEPAVDDARVYVELAEARSGPIPRGVDFSYIWGDALAELEAAAPDLRIANLETAVTTSEAYWKGKTVHYRMNPHNVPCLTAAGIDVCTLANNHVMDWSYAGLEETLLELETSGIQTTGAGRDLDEAQRPAVYGRVLVFGVGSRSSGIPREWAAGERRPGVHLIDESAPDSAERLQAALRRFTRPGDLAVLSIHWGPNWGYHISEDQRHLAHALIDSGVVDIVHSHSSHHVKPIEVDRDRPILYGCGDFLTDYEGIRGYERYRGDLGLMYLVGFDLQTRRLQTLEMRPMRTRQLQLRRPPHSDVAWLADRYNAEACDLGTAVEPTKGGALRLHHARAHRTRPGTDAPLEGKE